MGFVRTITGSVGRYLARRRRIRALRSRYRYLYRSGKKMKEPRRAVLLRSAGVLFRFLRF